MAKESAPPADACQALPERVKRLDEFTLHDLEATRLVLRGGSVIDWHRLNLTSEAAARQLIINHDFDPTDPVDRVYMEHIKGQAIAYLRRNFAFAIPKPVAAMSIEELLLLASARGHRQLCACTILKAIQIINHLSGRELLFRLPVSDHELFHLVEEKVYRVVGGMLNDGFPIAEFRGGRKSLDSMYTKLLSKSESTAAAIYDKLRFCIVTHTPDDLLPVLLYLTERLFPFNYVMANESVNSVINLTRYIESHPHLSKFTDDLQEPLEPAPSVNRFSADSYRVINFIADMPVRVPQHILEHAPPGTEDLGRTVYMLCEFQLLDAHTEASNEAGDASHDAYKARQRSAVARRLRLGARAVNRPQRIEAALLASEPPSVRPAPLPTSDPARPPGYIGHPPQSTQRGRRKDHLIRRRKR